jgi:hypothetical protein
MNAVETIRLAMRHHQAGELDQAESLYRQALALSPDHPDALHLLGALAGQRGRLDESIDLIGRVSARGKGGRGNRFGAQSDRGRPAICQGVLHHGFGADRCSPIRRCTGRVSARD